MDGSADAVVVGSGPNGLAGAITLARHGLRVAVFERDTEPGGGMRSAQLAGDCLFDVCSAVHPMAVASPFMRSIELTERVELAVPPISFGQPLGGARAALAYRDLDATVAALEGDGPSYRRLMGPLVSAVDELTAATLGGPVGAVSHPAAVASLGARTLELATPVRAARFRGPAAPALLAGACAHVNVRLPSLVAAGVGLVLTAYAHGDGWPVPIGGSQAIAAALAGVLADLGGTIYCGHEVTSLAWVRARTGARIILLDVGPAALAAMAGASLPDRYRRRLTRFRYGPAASKVDFVLAQPVPWSAAELMRAGTVHVGGRREEVEQAEAEVARGRHPALPYVLAVQPTPHDPGRAPAGRHVLSTYAHVPGGSDRDMTTAVVKQISRFAPGFPDIILASEAMPAQALARHNPNLVGGDIGGGAMTTRQLLARPTLARHPWRTPIPGVYLCSASTPPGPGVHGMCGWHAAQLALADLAAPRGRRPARIARSTPAHARTLARA